jgi:sarcosine oxidase
MLRSRLQRSVRVPGFHGTVAKKAGNTYRAEEARNVFLQPRKVTMSKPYDVIVAGVGGMGSATCWHLARRGQRVLGLERFDIPHAMGSSHAVNRIIRLAYFEHPSYVPLLRRAYELWRETEQLYGEQLLYVTGYLDVGAPDSKIIRGSLESCALHQIHHTVLDAAETNRRYPGYRLPSDYVAIYQQDGGFVASERAIVAHTGLAQAAGADIRAREAILDWSPTAGGGVRVRTDRGTYDAGRLVLSTGAWIGDHVPALKTEAIPERQVLGWFQPRDPAKYRLGVFPCGYSMTPLGNTYQFPVWHVPGFKVGIYNHLKEQGHADTLDRQPNRADEELLRAAVREYFPAADGPLMGLRACLFTNTRDEHFVLDRLPDTPQVIIASPCSGHGYKFASAIGEALADLATDTEPRADLALFALSRLRPT